VINSFPITELFATNVTCNSTMLRMIQTEAFKPSSGKKPNVVSYLSFVFNSRNQAACDTIHFDIDIYALPLPNEPSYTNTSMLVFDSSANDKALFGLQGFASMSVGTLEGTTFNPFTVVGHVNNDTSKMCWHHTCDTKPLALSFW
jgi:hypothetical protein